MYQQRAKDDYDDDLVFYIPFNIILVILTHRRLIMKSSGQWNAIQSWDEFCLKQDSNLGPQDPKLGSLTICPKTLFPVAWLKWHPLRGMDTLPGEVTPVKIILPPFWSGLYSKRKEFAPFGSKFFSFRVDPFSERDWYAGKQTGCHRSCLPRKSSTKYTKCSQPVPLREEHVVKHKYAMTISIHINKCAIIKATFRPYVNNEDID